MKIEWKSTEDEYGCKVSKLYFNEVNAVEIIEFDDGEIEIFGSLVKLLDFKQNLFESIDKAKQYVEDVIREFAVQFNTWYMR